MCFLSCTHTILQQVQGFGSWWGERIWPQVVINNELYLDGALWGFHGDWGGKTLRLWDFPETVVWGHHPKEAESQGTPGWKRNQRGEVISLDDASSQQDRSLGVKRATKSSSDLGPLVVSGFVYLRLTDVGYSFMGYAKQAGSKWLKSILIWAIFRTNGCARSWVWCQWAFELMVLAFRDEVNNVQLMYGAIFGLFM